MESRSLTVTGSNPIQRTLMSRNRREGDDIHNRTKINEAARIEKGAKANGLKSHEPVALKNDQLDEKADSEHCCSRRLSR